MGKRFISTDIFSDDWFMELTVEQKLTWIYLITNCNHAGLFKINKKLFHFQTGFKNFDTIIKQLGNRIVTVTEQLYFIPKFIDFQYPSFPNSAVKQQNSAIELLKKSGLWDENTNSYITVTKESQDSYGNEHENEYVMGAKIEKPKDGVGFDIFWKAYPKKKSKGDAEKWWNKNKPSRELLIEMLAAIGKAKTSRDWEKEGGQYIPHPATWLNSKGWEDELVESEKPFNPSTYGQEAN